LNALDYILAGLEAHLKLERELGRRIVEIDRRLLDAQKPTSCGSSVSSDDIKVFQEPKQDAAKAEAVEKTLSSKEKIFDFVFVHDKSLTPEALEMMDKIIAALGRSKETAPIVFEGALPKAKAYAVLGALALKKYFPGLKGVPGQWLTGDKGEQVLVTYSPHYILRFAVVTPAVKKIKEDMWKSLKTLLQRIR
jgi:hypothetical protein